MEHPPYLAFRRQFAPEIDDPGRQVRRKATGDGLRGAATWSRYATLLFAVQHGLWRRPDTCRRRPEYRMIGLVLVTHGRLATEFRAALEHVVGPQTHLETVTIGPEDNMELRRRDIIEAVARADTGKGVAILTDMFGGTPSNLAISVMNGRAVEVVAGINLPMLVRLASVRGDMDLKDAVAQAQDAGRKYIHVASRVLNGK
jgi:PTS system mannose-specific IIA component